MTALLARLDAQLDRIPHDLIAALARLGIGTTFLRSGLLKLDGWADGTTLALFRDEYRLPLLPPDLAAPLAMGMELSMPVLLFLGLLTRPAALILLGMTAVIEIFVYPNAFDTHAVWAVALLYLAKFGPGTLSLDALFTRGRSAAAPGSHPRPAAPAPRPVR
ncbi:putative oxidoreductase [Enhydrobacter aerosaccus]|uniref:Putative oxidoreductase n=1 Tax=Enhydrobacter aerosaccus TaxID=225324 RepID=A0A1T4TG51_9HYPH|nr:DoxX family protein [Enhydrobacter aerosaccus]SKA39436.1 putative oxidoreductase [Enhydrobacter aerosaccus]